MKKIIKSGLLGLMGSASLIANGAEKPNILFIFADDQRADALGCSGNGYINTPNIDKLAHNGVRFTNSYVMGGNQAAISAPSRAMMLSGKSLFNVMDVLDGVTTMPMVFAQNGYETFGTGKWHNGAKNFEASFQKGKDVMVQGMSDHYNVPCQDLDENRKLGKVTVKGFSTEIFGDAAIQYLNNYSKADKKNPFFCYVAFTAPHDPRSPAKEYIGMYKDEAMPLPGNYMPYHPFAFDNMKIRDENLANWPRSTEIIKASLADYYALISHMDKKIGEIIETLKENELYDNTIIVYAADNGLGVGSHGLLGKQNLYEHSMKVPMIFFGKGVPKGQVKDALVYLYDIFPTLCSLSKIKAPAEIDGKSLVKIIKGKEKSVRDVLFTAYRTTVRAVRDAEWKLIRYPDRDYTQLFNLKNDPLELVNLANVPEFKGKVDEMTALLIKCQKEANDTCPLTAKKILPLFYDPTTFKQSADANQPQYVLDRYFKDADLSKPRQKHD